MLARLARWIDGPLADRVTAFASSERVMELPSGERLPVRALGSIGPDDVAGAHVIHLAYLTKEKAAELGERRFFDGNIAIDDAVLDALAGKPAASVFVASSGAAKLAATGVDLHPYGMAKVRQEARFLEWAAAGGVPVVAGRIFNIAGPHINKLEAYAVSNFILQALNCKKIEVQANIPVFRSFLHVDDLCDLVIGMGLRKISRPRPIDLCGAEVVEMADIAALVAAQTGSPPVRRATLDYGRASEYLGNFPHTKVLAMELGFDLKSLSAQINDSVHWISGGLNRKVLDKKN